MKTDRPWKNVLRSPRGQFILLAIAFGGALLLAGTALAMRSLVFERFVREKYPPATDALRTTLAAAVHDESKRKGAADLSADDFFIAYGLSINEEIDDPGLRLPRAWAASRPQELFDRLRATSVAGSRGQRLRAIEFLDLIVDPRLAEERERWKALLRERARRRGETEIVERLDGRR